jgi:hypothetical protein
MNYNNVYLTAVFIVVYFMAKIKRSFVKLKLLCCHFFTLYDEAVYTYQIRIGCLGNRFE